MKWNAYYFDKLDPVSTPSRVTTIEAYDEDEAGKIAIASMGRSMRVHVTRPLWGGGALRQRAEEDLQLSIALKDKQAPASVYSCTHHERDDGEGLDNI
jgi:hypothetical protein